MFDVPHSAESARRYAKMQSIYHRGQKLVWDGNQVLEELWQRHGGSGLAEGQREAAGRVLGAIMWGELAAWRIAAQLADELEPLEAKMAATSQAHDEARHFYVMHDYLVRATGDFPRRMPKWSEKLIAATLGADTMPKKIIGMQLQLETTALTIFHALRESKLCPVLSELLVYYEKDEARHVGLGTQLLPTLMKGMGVRERVEFSAFSFKIAAYSMASLKGSERDLRALGIDPRRVAVLGKSKQMMVFDELWQLAPDAKSDAGERLGMVFDAVAEAMWPDRNADPSLGARARRVLRTLSTGYETTETVLDPAESPAAAE
jgi:uncharacterized ferritin-like protein (DUF455 family)